MGLPQEPASHPDEQQRRNGRGGEIDGRDEREREGEGQVGGALEPKLDDGEAQEVVTLLRQAAGEGKHVCVFEEVSQQPVKRWHQCHERENKEQLQQEHVTSKARTHSQPRSTRFSRQATFM